MCLRWMFDLWSLLHKVMLKTQILSSHWIWHIVYRKYSDREDGEWHRGNAVSTVWMQETSTNDLFPSDKVQEGQEGRADVKIKRSTEWIYEAYLDPDLNEPTTNKSWGKSGTFEYWLAFWYWETVGYFFGIKVVFYKSESFRGKYWNTYN